jgi:hypothetical protein
VSESFRDPPRLIPVEVGPIRWFAVQDLAGATLGAFWLAVRSGRCGFLPARGRGGMAAAAVWNERAMLATRTVGHGRDAFAYWRRGGPAWQVGPTRTAASLAALRAHLRRTTGDRSASSGNSR